jgi:hypothetical protein
LKALAIANNCDKWGYNWYTGHYERHFGHLRRRKLNVLEIGVGGYEDPLRGGASLRMWRTYFPNSHIYGIDIHDKRPHDERRIKTFRGSQIDEAFLERVVSEIGKIDIIIDDGSHVNDHIIRTFKFLFPRLVDEGVYVVEDTVTSYWSSFGGSSEDLQKTDTAIGFLKGLVDGLCHGDFEDPGYQASYLDEHIVAMHFYPSLAFVQKGRNAERRGSIEPNKCT